MVDEDRIRSAVAPVIEGLGLRVVRIVWGRKGRTRTLRVDIDTPSRGRVPVPYRGSTLTAEELADATREVSAALDARDPVAGGYVLEVSTPGLDRPLCGASDFQEFHGHEVAVTLHSSLEGRRRFRGINAGVEGEGRDAHLVIEDGSGAVRLPVDRIKSANLVMGAGVPGSGPGGRKGRPKRRRKR
jgi:ribosome maturation factor RimP